MRDSFMKTRKPEFESLAAALKHHGIQTERDVFLFMLGAAVSMDIYSCGEMNDLKRNHITLVAYFTKMAHREPNESQLAVTRDDVSKALAKVSKAHWYDGARRFFCQRVRKHQAT
jgi:hypothetical protein